MNKTIAIYARTGRNEETSGKSIDAQVIACTQAAKRLYGENINISVYEDRCVGHSGYKPALHSLEGDVSNEVVSVVVATGLDRLGRSTRRALGTVDGFRKHKVDFVSVRDGRHWKSNVLRTDIELLILEKESEFRSKRMWHAWERRKSHKQSETTI